ncbi:MAG: NIPSNAP family protein, partial [Variibacter sp.]|nr:NIPSNAP family protein [Variibacter sp.]
MSIDVTIIQVRPGTMPRALPRLQEALGRDAGKLMAVWTTDIGMLNQLMLLRQYESAHQAAQSHAAHVTSDNP